MKKIVIVEDEIFMREELAYLLEKAGYTTFCITDFTNLAEQIVSESPQLVLLDLKLPGVTGFEICKTVKEKSPVPILVLTSCDQLRDELHALSLGADEYLTKPCSSDRLLARISNLFRRYEDRGQFVEIKGVKLDVITYTMYVGEHSVALTENQGKIMELLLQNVMSSSDIVTKEQLLEKIWGTRDYIDDNALQVNMTRLKKAMRGLPMKYEIAAVRGKGYRLSKIEELSDG